MYRNIIVPVDLDNADKSKAMIDAVKDVADKQSKVTLVNVVEDVPGLITAELPDGLAIKAAHEARGRLVEIAKEAGLDADVEIRSGRPHHAIVELAKDKGADLIVIASHSPGLRNYLLGSTAANVVRHADCSVLVCR
jgi:nucleotide-binding universal stress UspA family protein